MDRVVINDNMSGRSLINTDGIMVFTIKPKHLQNMLDNLEFYCPKWELKVFRLTDKLGTREKSTWWENISILISGYLKKKRFYSRKEKLIF